MDYVKIPSGTSQAQQIAAMNNNFGQLANESVTKIYNDANGLPHISIGIQKDGSSRIRIAKANIDVTTATDDQLVFNSDQNTLKVVKSGILNLTQATIASPGPGLYDSDTGVLGSVDHGLGYTPAVLSYIEFSSGLRTPLPYQSLNTGSSSSAVWDSYFPVVSSTSFRVDYRRIVYGMGALTFALPISVKYFLLQESAT